MDNVNESSPAASMEDIVQAKAEHLPFQDEETGVEEACQEEGEVIGYFELDPSAGLQLMQGENTIYLPPEALGDHVLMSEAGKSCQQIIVVVEEGPEGDMTGLGQGPASETSFSEECHTVLSEDAFQVQGQVSQEAEGSLPEGHQQLLILSDGDTDIQGVPDSVVAVTAEGDGRPAEGSVVIYTESPCIVPSTGLERLEFSSASQSEMTTVLKSPDLLKLAEQSGCALVNVAEVEEVAPTEDAKHESHCHSILHPFPGDPVAELASDSQAKVPQPDSLQDECAEGFEETRVLSAAGSMVLQDTSQDAPNDTTGMPQHISIPAKVQEDVNETGVRRCGVTTDEGEMGYEVPPPDSISINEHIGETTLHDCAAENSVEGDTHHHEKNEHQEQRTTEEEMLQPKTRSCNGGEEVMPSTMSFPTPVPVSREAEHSLSISAGATELQSGLASHFVAVGTALQYALSSHTAAEESGPSDLLVDESPTTSAHLEDTSVTDVQLEKSRRSDLIEDKLLPASIHGGAPSSSQNISEAVGDSEQQIMQMRHSDQQSSSVCKWEERQCLSQVAPHEPEKTEERAAEPEAGQLSEVVCTSENEGGISQYSCRTLKELAEEALERDSLPEQAQDEDRKSLERASYKLPRSHSDNTVKLFETGLENFQPPLCAEVGVPRSKTVPCEPLLEAHVKDVAEKDSVAESPLHIGGTDNVEELSAVYAAGSEAVFMEREVDKASHAMPLTDVGDVDEACRESILPDTPYQEASTDQPGSLFCVCEHVPFGNADSAGSECEHGKHMYLLPMTGSKTADDGNQNCNGVFSVSVKGKEVDASESMESLSTDLHINLEDSAVVSQDENTPIVESSVGPKADIPDIAPLSEADEQAGRGSEGSCVERTVGEELMAALELVPCQESSVLSPNNGQGVEETSVEPVSRKEKKRKKKLRDPPGQDAEDLPAGKKRWCLRTPTKPRKRLIIPDSDEDDFDTYDSFDIPQETQRSKSEDAFDALLNIFKIEQAKKATETALTKSRKERKVAADTTRSRGANAGGVGEHKARRSTGHRKKAVERRQSKSPEISLAPGDDTAQGSLTDPNALSLPVSKPECKHKSGQRKSAASSRHRETVSCSPSTRTMLAGDIHIRCQRPVSSPEKSVPQYHCSKCGFRSARMDNIVRHHKDDCPHTKNFFKWDHEMLKRVTGLDSGYHPS